MAMRTERRDPPNDPVTIDRLREIALFGGLSDAVLGHLATSLKVLRVAPGEILFREGDPGREMFVVLEGEVEVMKKSRRGRDMRVALLGPSDGFGEMSLIDVQPRSAMVRSVAPTRLLRMTSEDFDALYRHDLKSYTLIILNIARDLSRRLRTTDGILADITANVLDEYVAGGRPQGGARG